MDLIKKSHELAIAMQELAFQNEEKEVRASELIIANKELAYQNSEKEKRAAELLIANTELAFQNHEKEKRAEELLFANKELAFLCKEKENLAAELIIANRELAFQNTEKDKRALELTLANEELRFQNSEKEKRAAELTLAYNELRFQNEEKEKRAAELISANKYLKNVETQLQDVNKELEAFSYSVSHDLRAPLRAISGYSTMLKEDYQPRLDGEANRIIDVIVDKTNLMSQLIDDLLTFSKMSRLEKVNHSINMGNIVEKCINELAANEIPLTCQIIINKLFECTGDGAMLKQVWFNLISNAIKFSSKQEKPLIEIGSDQDDKNLFYYIKDNGTGFDMKYSQKLFGVFQRLHRQDEFEGTGLGLALAKRIISKHGGEIWAQSVLHEGTTFNFSIPKPLYNEQ